MPKRSASAAFANDDSDAPAVMRIAELTNNANVKSEIESSTIEYLRQKFMAGREGKYGCLSEFEDGTEGVTCPALTSYSWRRDWTIPLPK